MGKIDDSKITSKLINNGMNQCLTVQYVGYKKNNFKVEINKLINFNSLFNNLFNLKDICPKL